MTTQEAGITIPDTQAGLEDLLNDRKRMAQVINSGDLPKVVQAYASQFFTKERETAETIKDEVQRQVALFLKENGEPVRPSVVSKFSPGTVKTQNAFYNPRAMGAAIDNEFDDAGSYFRAIWHQTNRDANLQMKLQRVRNAFSSTVPSEGGFLIPETLRSEMLRVSLETSIIRPRARTIPMESLRVPFPMIDSTSNASSVYGGITCYWTEESAAMQDTSPRFGRLVLDAKKLTGYCEVPNELISDSIGSFDAFISQIFPEALAFFEDDAFLNGSGVGEPLGILKGSGMVSVAAEGGQPITTIVWENIVKMFSRMLPSSLGRAVWVASIDTFPELATMALTVGVGGGPIWLNNGVSGPPMTILGRPVIFTEKSPVLGQAGDIAFIDPSYYLIGDRQVMSASSSPHFRFQNDETAFKIIERVDGRPWLQSAITPKNGSAATLSPFVQIAARA